MEVDESKMRVAPGFWQKLRNSIFALIFGVFFLWITPGMMLIIFLPSIWFYVVLSLCAIICLVIGWIYGDDFVDYLHTNIVNRWNPMNRFR
jgi:hypothetical protein